MGYDCINSPSLPFYLFCLLQIDFAPVREHLVFELFISIGENQCGS